MTQIFVIHDGVHEEGDDTQNPECNQLMAEKVGEVEAEFKPMIAVTDLHDEAGDHHHENEQHLDEHERKQLAAKQYPAANRQRIHDLRESGIALPPDQFAGIKGDDRQNEERESGATLLQHPPGHRVCGSGERIIDSRGRKNGEESARQHEHGKKNALNGFGELKARQKEQFAQRVGEQECGMSLGQRVRRGRERDRRGIWWWLARCFAGSVAEREEHISDAQNSRPDREPQEAIPNQHAAERHELQVALEGCPVLCEVGNGISAKRIDHRGQRSRRQVIRKLGGDEVSDQEQHTARIHGEHFPS